jgi:predicted DNA-binding transcriptional regulator AlpA
MKPKRLKPWRDFVRADLGVSDATGYRLSKADPRFPKSLNLSGRRMIEVGEGEAYIEALIARRDAAAEAA